MILLEKGRRARSFVQPSLLHLSCARCFERRYALGSTLEATFEHVGFDFERSSSGSVAWRAREKGRRRDEGGGVSSRLNGTKLRGSPVALELQGAHDGYGTYLGAC